MDPTENRFWAKVDKNGSNGCWIWTASLDSHGYGQFQLGRLNGKQRSVRAHRVSYEFHKGPIPYGYQLDHICHVRGCVNPDHLRVCTTAENTRNANMRCDNTSGFKGASWDEGTKKWRAAIHYKGKTKYLGLFKSPELAHEAYKKEAIRLFGDFANDGEGFQ